MPEPVWLMIAAVYGFGMAQVLRLRLVFGLPLLAVTGIFYLVVVNIVSAGDTRLDLSTFWSAGLLLGLVVALIAKHRSDQRMKHDPS